MILILFLFLSFHYSQCQTLKTTVWQETFKNNTGVTWCQCESWVNFWQFWIGDISKVVSITVEGSLNRTKYTCSGASAQFVAFALATPPFDEFQVNCGSLTWYIWQFHWHEYAGSAIGINSNPIYCNNDPAIRPCWPGANFGGIGTPSCNMVGQTFKVTVVSDISNVATTFPPSVFWQDSFTSGVVQTSAQCAKWRQFWQTTVPRGQTLSVTLTSSINGGVSTTCSGVGIGLMATGLATTSSNGLIHCNDGKIWFFNGLYPPYDTSAIQVEGTPTRCNSQLAIRPCWNTQNADFGGFGGSNCQPPSENFTATVTIAPKQISNICFSMVNLYTAGSIYTLTSCNAVQLTCNSTANCTNCIASGFSTTTGVYTCNPNNTWSPAIPSCTPIGPSLQTTTTTILTTSGLIGTTNSDSTTTTTADNLNVSTTEHNTTDTTTTTEATTTTETTATATNVIQTTNLISTDISSSDASTIVIENTTTTKTSLIGNVITQFATASTVTDALVCETHEIIIFIWFPPFLASVMLLAVGAIFLIWMRKKVKERREKEKVRESYNKD